MYENELLREAKLVLENSYSPYSRFKVGAAIRTKDGKIFTGINVENASYSLTMCAERVAIFKAISAGHRLFTDLAIASSEPPTFPCGACRRVLSEFSLEGDLRISLEGTKKEVFRLTDLLPHACSTESWQAFNTTG
jgi:cytidine deaminase